MPKRLTETPAGSLKRPMNSVQAFYMAVITCWLQGVHQQEVEIGNQRWDLNPATQTRDTGITNLSCWAKVLPFFFDFYSFIQQTTCNVQDQNLKKHANNLVS